jgi:hypothetical protein
MMTRFDYRALGRLPQGVMNKTEAAYADHLEQLKRIGQVLWYKFEGMKFRLADKTFLTPDFAVMMEDGHMELHDTKGFMTDDANVKIKVAAEMYPFLFVIVRRAKTGWTMKAIKE